MKTHSKLTLTSLTHLAFHINALLDSNEDFDLSYAEIYEASEQGYLLEHLAKRLQDRANLDLLISMDPERVTAIEVALRDAAEALRGREQGKACISNSGLCLVMAIILEALQQNFAPQFDVPEPNQEPMAADASDQ